MSGNHYDVQPDLLVMTANFSVGAPCESIEVRINNSNFTIRDVTALLAFMHGLPDGDTPRKEVAPLPEDLSSTRVMSAPFVAGARNTGSASVVNPPPRFPDRY